MSIFGASPNLLIIGTSNSIQRHGYTKVIGGAFARIQNLAIGSSTGILNGLRGRDVTIRNGYGIYEHCVNETRLSRAMGMNETIHLASKQSFLDICFRHNLKPILVVMPSHWHYGEMAEIHKTHIAFAQTYGVPYFDGYAFTRRLYAIEPRFAPCGFCNGAHSLPPLAQAIGLVLSYAIKQQDQWAEAMCDGHILDCVALGGDRVYRTSIDERRFTLIREGETVTVDVPDGHSIVGVAFNAAQSNGTMEVAGFRKKLHSSLYQTRPYLLVVWPFKHMLANQGAVTVTCLHGDAADAEDNDHRADVDLSNPQLEIAALITAAPKSFPYNRCTGTLDMLGGLSDDTIRDLVKNVAVVLE